MAAFTLLGIAGGVVGVLAGVSTAVMVALTLLGSVGGVVGVVATGEDTGEDTGEAGSSALEGGDGDGGGGNSLSGCTCDGVCTGVATTGLAFAFPPATKAVPTLGIENLLALVLKNDPIPAPHAPTAAFASMAAWVAAAPRSTDC